MVRIFVSEALTQAGSYIRRIWRSSCGGHFGVLGILKQLPVAILNFCAMLLYKKCLKTISMGMVISFMER
ncbi:hypothetical protein BC938DRAFT_476108 [Jimgerdemannia flammicorona]|uniref:Uncharacterized protein n=1 Tax=Jimgerdemannia flammicorona TaxID=994334 RepID=A0A433QQW9_9FUNG|nr:hypothetical protein BC938DRAFT_476108 [Jimgerdemannia flammicorona]